MAAPRKPQDHQPKTSSRQEPVEGLDLLRSVASMRSREQAEVQARILETFGVIGIDLDDVNPGDELDVDTTPATIRALGDLSGVIEDFVAEDQHEAFVKFDSGPGAQARIVNLAMGFLAALGESEGSAN